MKTTTFASIHDYISQCNIADQPLLQTMLATIQQAAPDATEAIKYQMPTFIYYGNLVHFAACKTHIGFYPAPAAIVKFAKALEPFKTSKGAVQFPYNKPIPWALITKMVTFRVAENTRNFKQKNKENK